MLNNIRAKQTILVTAIVLLIGFLFSRDVKGLVKPAENSNKGVDAEASSSAPVSTLAIDEVSNTAKNLVSLATAKEITALEREFQAANGPQKASIARRLSDKWNDVEQMVPSGMYAEIAAKTEPSLKDWLVAGNRLLTAFENTSPQDSLVKTAMLQKANTAFKSAVALDGSDKDAKTGLGVTMVNGMGAPMEGIALLREVVAEDPKNLKANMNLGKFAITSGQLDKAIVRFNDIITNIKATPDAYFFLATAYEGLEKNKEAIDAYLNAKKLAANPTFSKFIDDKVAELKNKR